MMMMYELEDDAIEPDFLDELLDHKSVAQQIDMRLRRKYYYHSCPHCQGFNAFPVTATKKEIVHVCGWCEGEFK